MMLNTSLPLSTVNFIIVFFFAVNACNCSPLIGVTYTPPRSARPPTPEQIPAAISSLKLDCLRLSNPDPAVVRAFSYSNTSLLLSIPNAAVPSVATNISAAADWLRRYVVPFYPRARISTISVGTDLLSSANLLLPAIINTHLSLLDMGIPHISVSTTFSFSAVISLNSSSSPPSTARFYRHLIGTIISPLLNFLHATNSSFLVKLFPYEAYMANVEVPLGFALFQEEAFGYRDDPRAGVRYRNLFDMMVGAVIQAMKAAGHGGVPVVVAETGWPVASRTGWDGDATAVYAEMYIRGLVRHLRSRAGTTAGVAEVYVYELMDGDARGGKRWGILYPNMSRKYSFEFSKSDRLSSGEDGGFILKALLLLVASYLLW